MDSVGLVNTDSFDCSRANSRCRWCSNRSFHSLLVSRRGVDLSSVVRVLEVGRFIFEFLVEVVPMHEPNDAGEEASHVEGAHRCVEGLFWPDGCEDGEDEYDGRDHVYDDRSSSDGDDFSVLVGWSSHGGSVVSVQIGIRLRDCVSAELLHRCHWINVIAG